MTEPPKTATPSVFISYSSADRPLVRSLVEYLETDGFRVWWDRAVDPGEEFDIRIEAELAGASCAVVVWSADSVRSKWVLSEAMAAFERNGLVPVTLDPTVSIPLPFNRLHTASLEGWSGDSRHPGLQELVQGIRSLLAKGAAARKQAASQDQQMVVAVVPFDDLTGGEEATPMCRLVADALIKALSRFGNLETLSRRASFDPRLEGLEVRALARTLRANYVVTGTIVSHGDETTVHVELADGRSGREVWSAPMRLPGSDPSELSRVATDVARTLSGVFMNLALEGADDEGAEPWQLVAAGRKILLRNTAEAIGQAREKAREALDADPENGQACALLASAFVEEVVNGHTDHIEERRAEAIELTELALIYCVDDPIILKYAGHILSCCGKHDQGVKALRRGLDLNPYDDGAFGYLGWGLAPSTSPDHLAEIVPILDRLLNNVRKHQGRPFWSLHMSVARTCQADFSGAYESAREALDFSPRMTLAWLHALNALGQLGREAEAEALMSRCPVDLSALRNRVIPIVELLSRDEEALSLRTAGLRALSLV